MRRTSVNPFDWGLQWQMDQAQVFEGIERTLHCSGQVAVKPDPEADIGIRVPHPGDMREQLHGALQNLDAVLAAGGFTRQQLLNLRFYTTDIEAFIAHYDVYADWIASAGIRPPQSLLGVQRLFMPELVVEIEAIAGA